MSSAGGSKKRKLGEDVQKFYAVRAGRVPGVYMTWKECQDHTTGFGGALCMLLSPFYLTRIPFMLDWI